MFAPDIASLRQFYASPFGKDVHALIAAALADLWPAAKGDVVLAIGYATPYLAPLMADAAQAMACSPAQQGAAPWPPQQNVVFLSHESELPLRENSVNRVLLIHSVEHSEQLAPMLDDIWRILTPGGRVLAVVPNRMGWWSRSSRSPFGYGRPFSIMQLRDVIADHQFTLTRSSSALFIPPTKSRLAWKFASKIEMVGRALCPFFGGVLLVEAEKQLYASIRQPVSIRKKYAVQMGVPQPVLGKA